MYDSSPLPRVTPMESMVVIPAAFGDRTLSTLVDAASDAPSKSWSQRTRSLLGVQIVATGSYLPERSSPTPILQSRYGCDSAWIEIYGILARRYVAPEQATSDLCIELAKRAFWGWQDRTCVQIDLVVVGTFTPDYQCPTTANSCAGCAWH